MYLVFEHSLGLRPSVFMFTNQIQTEWSGEFITDLWYGMCMDCQELTVVSYSDLVVIIMM